MKFLKISISCFFLLLTGCSTETISDRLYTQAVGLSCDGKLSFYTEDFNQGIHVFDLIDPDGGIAAPDIILCGKQQMVSCVNQFFQIVISFRVEVINDDQSSFSGSLFDDIQLSPEI